MCLDDLARRLLDIYRGPLFGSEPGADCWALGPRERIACKFSRVADLLGRTLEKEGLFAPAAALYRRALDGNPNAELFCAGLMRCALASGGVADAPRIFEEYRAQLAVSGHAEPGSEIASLYAQLRRHTARDRAQL